MIQLKIKVSLFESDIIQVGIRQNFLLRRLRQVDTKWNIFSMKTEMATKYHPGSEELKSKSVEEYHFK
jgi:hypothetical protein